MDLNDEAALETLKGVTARAGRFRAPLAVPAELGPDTFRGLAISTDPVFKLVMETIESCVTACVTAPDAHAYFKGLEKHWRPFVDALDIMEKTSALKCSPEAMNPERGAAEFAKAVHEAATALDGSAGLDEAEFATQTYRRAIRLAKVAAAAESTPFRDEHDLACQFWYYAAVHLFGALALVAAAADDSIGATPAGIETSFSLLRLGALNAYAATREVIDRREAASESDDPGPIDDAESARAIDWAEADLRA